MKTFLKVVITIIIVAILLISLIANVCWLRGKLIENKIALQAEMQIQDVGNMYTSYYQMRGYHITVIPCDTDYVTDFGNVHKNSLYYIVLVVCSFDGYGSYVETFLAEYNHGTILINGL